MTKVMIELIEDYSEDYNLADYGGRIIIDDNLVWEYIPDRNNPKYPDTHGFDHDAMVNIAVDLLGYKDRMVIETNSDSHDCETCGCNYDSGGTVTIDGNVVYDYQAMASCWGNYDLNETQLKIIGLMSQDIWIENDQWYDPNLNQWYEDFNKSR